MKIFGMNFAENIPNNEKLVRIQNDGDPTQCNLAIASKQTNAQGNMHHTSADSDAVLATSRLLFCISK